jgi:poly(beta-D-mannuronate) lyase
MDIDYRRWDKEPQEGCQHIHVSSAEQLYEAIRNTAPGTTIVLADGIYKGVEAFTIRVKATIDEPVTIRAANPGKAIITGGACFKIQDSSYIIIIGLMFTNTGHSAIELNDCDHVRITRNTFALVEDGTELRWLLIQGENSHHHWIDHNDFGPRRDKGMYVSSDGGNGQMSRYDVYEYNYFHGSGPAFPRSEGEIKALRIGLSKVSMSDGFNLIQYNLFEHCDANPEIISLKSCRNEVRFNTFHQCEGHLTSRHGHANSFYGNIFIGDGQKKGMGGFRIYGNDHSIHDNLMEKLTDWAVNLDSGSHDAGPEGSDYTKEVLTAHWRIYRAHVYRNLIIDGPGIAIGGSKPYEPVDVRVENNISNCTNSELLTIKTETNAIIEGNQTECTEPPAGLLQDEWKEHQEYAAQMKGLTAADVGPDAP